MCMIPQHLKFAYFGLSNYPGIPLSFKSIDFRKVFFQQPVSQHQLMSPQPRRPATTASQARTTVALRLCAENLLPKNWFESMQLQYHHKQLQQQQ